MSTYAPRGDRTAGDINFENAVRYREKRNRASLLNGMPVGILPDPTWDHFWGGLDRAKEAANEAGMNFRADLGGIGQWAEPTTGGINPLERQSLKYQAMQRQGDADVMRAKMEMAGQRALVNAESEQRLADLKEADTERAVNEAFADPNASREQVLQRLPPALRPIYAQQWAKQDADTLRSQAEMIKARRDDSPLVAVMGKDGRSILVPRSQAVGMQPASSREQGRAVTSGDAGRIADFDTSLDDVTTLRQTLQDTKGSTGTVAKIGAMLPNVVTDVTGWGTEPKQRQAVIDRVKQVIGKALEGGVLRKEDEAKYEKILPTIGDTADVAASKMDGLEAALRQRRQTLVDALSDAGYEVGSFNARAPHGRPKAPAASGDAKDPLGIRGR